MHTKIIEKVSVVLLFAIVSSTSVFAQKDSIASISLSANADLVSRYIWRGQDYGHTPSVQPGLSATWKDFTIGAWGAYRLAGEGDDEFDLYASKTIGPVSLSVWDYWSYSKTYPSNFLNYNRETTSHLLEGQILLSGGDKLPFNLLGSYFFYGSDPSKSIYLELQYVQPIKNAELVFIAGYQPKGSFYAQKAVFVNVGLTLTQPLSITDSYSLDLLLSLIANPDNKSVYFTVGISLYK